MLTQIFDKCDVILIGTVFDGIGLPLIAFPYGMGVDTDDRPDGAARRDPRSAALRRGTAARGRGRIPGDHRPSPQAATGPDTDRRRGTIGAVQGPADYDATDET